MAVQAENVKILLLGSFLGIRRNAKMVIQAQNVKIWSFCSFLGLATAHAAQCLKCRDLKELHAKKARPNLKDLALLCFKELQSPTSRVWAMFQFPLVEQDKISSPDDFQGWGVLSLATPVLKFGETIEFSYVVGNQSGWVGKLTQNFLNPFDIPSRP